MTIDLLVILLVATSALLGLVRSLVRAVGRDGYGAPRPDPTQGWFSPLDR